MNDLGVAHGQENEVFINPAKQCATRQPEPFASKLSLLLIRYSSLGLLIVLWLSAGLFWYCSCLSLKTPRLFGDELNYWDMAHSFHQGLNIPYWSVNYDIPTQLFSYLISPVFAFHGKVHAYEAARLVIPFLITTVVFPAYLLAREFVDRRYAFAVAILSVATPCMVYSSTLMTENLFYPLFVGAFLGAYRALCSGRLRDSLIAAFFFAVTYYTKPHVLVLIAAYTLCTIVWLLVSLLERTSLEEHNAWKGFGLRLIPIFAFSIALVPRILRLPSDERGLGAILVGGGYQGLLQPHSVLHLPSFFAAWSGLLLSTLVATVFIPFPFFVISIFQLKNMDWRRRWFWLLTALVWLAYTALAARHTVINEGVVRIHERYIFMMFPLFFVWYFLVREQQSKRFTTVAALIGVAISAAIMRWPAHVFLGPHVNTDSPSLTGFLCMAWIHNLTFFSLALLVVAIGCVAALFAFSRTILLQVTAWTLILASLSIGWVQFEKRWVNPSHIRLQELALDISNRIGSQATLGMLINGRNWLPQFHLGFWMEQPTVMYDVDSSQVPGSFSLSSPYVRQLASTENGDLDFGTPAPDYLISTTQFESPLSLVASYTTSSNMFYLYRIPPGSRGK
jgi:hypothetical protein